MSNPSAILESLAGIARHAAPAAVAWHVILALALMALIGGWRPNQRLAALLLAAPLASVAAAAWLYGNPFNGSVLLAATIGLSVLAMRLHREKVRGVAVPARTFAVLLLALGWSYPHFLEGLPKHAYLYAAPLGILPCPTLSATIGLSILAGGFGSRTWSGLLSALGLFYGIFGALRLGVLMDALLAVGAVVLLAVTHFEPRGIQRVTQLPRPASSAQNLRS